jgi:hypothetical protein
MSNNAMNRRISENSENLDTRDNRQRPQSMSGTSVQQLWKIGTFHEKRLYNIEQQIHKLTYVSKQEEGNSLRLELQNLIAKVSRLEHENSTFRKFIQTSRKSEKKSVSLEIEEE